MHFGPPNPHACLMKRPKEPTCHDGVFDLQLFGTPSAILVLEPPIDIVGHPPVDGKCVIQSPKSSGFLLRLGFPHHQSAVGHKCSNSHFVMMDGERDGVMVQDASNSLWLVELERHPVALVALILELLSK